MVHLLHFRFHSSSPGCLRSTTLSLSLWGPVDCNFGDGVGTIAQHVSNPAHFFLVMMVSISCRWHRAKRSRLEAVLGQKMRQIFLRLVMRKDDSLARTCSVICQHSDPCRGVDNLQLWWSFSVVLMLYCDDLHTAFRLLKAFLALLSLKQATGF